MGHHKAPLAFGAARLLRAAITCFGEFVDNFAGFRASLRALLTIHSSTSDRIKMLSLRFCV
jgi:hypothetical protein